MILINSTIAMGDLLQSFPTMTALIAHFPEQVYIHFVNKEVGSLFPLEQYGALPLSALPTDSKQRVLNINIHDFINGRTNLNNMVDFRSSMAMHFGYETLPDFPVPINYDEDVPAYDFIIAPYVLNNANKNMRPDFWQGLVDELRATYTDCSIAVIGSLTVPKKEHLAMIERHTNKWDDPDWLKNNFTKYLSGVDYYTDQPLTKVATLLKRVRKCFICPDSGPAHLANIVGCPTIELYTWAMITKRSRNEAVNSREELITTLPIVMKKIGEVIK